MTSETSLFAEQGRNPLISEAAVNALLACFTVPDLLRSGCVYGQLPPVSASFAS